MKERQEKLVTAAHLQPILDIFTKSDDLVLLRAIDAKICEQLTANLVSENMKSTQNAGIILALTAYFSLKEKKFAEPSDILSSEGVLAYFTESGYAGTRRFIKTDCRRQDLTNHMHVIEYYLKKHFTKPNLTPTQINYLVDVLCEYFLTPDCAYRESAILSCVENLAPFDMAFTMPLFSMMFEKICDVYNRPKKLALKEEDELPVP